MRTLLTVIFAATSLIASFGQAPAVVQKIGYADADYIFSQLPEFKQVESDMKTHSAQLQAQMEAKSKELETKYRTYQGMPATTPDAIRADKERELQQLQEGIQKFQQDAQTSLQRKQETLTEPLYTKIGKAIDDVAKENGYSFILSPQAGGGDIILYGDDKYDISVLVLKKLGITPAPKPTTPTK